MHGALEWIVILSLRLSSSTKAQCLWKMNHWQQYFAYLDLHTFNIITQVLDTTRTGVIMQKNIVILSLHTASASIASTTVWSLWAALQRTICICYMLLAQQHPIVLMLTYMISYINTYPLNMPVWVLEEKDGCFSVYNITPITKIYSPNPLILGILVILGKAKIKF